MKKLMNVLSLGSSLVFVMLTMGCGFENSQQRLRTAVDAQQDNLNACYARALAANAEVSGTMKMLVHVPRSANPGHINDAQFAGGEFEDVELQRCVRATLIGVKIGAAPLNDDLNVEYTLAFEPQKP